MKRRYIRHINDYDRTPENDYKKDLSGTYNKSEGDYNKNPKSKDKNLNKDTDSTIDNNRKYYCIRSFGGFTKGEDYLVIAHNSSKVLFYRDGKKVSVSIKTFNKCFMI